jgi:hypothetical protein
VPGAASGMALCIALLFFAGRADSNDAFDKRFFEWAGCLGSQRLDLNAPMGKNGGFIRGSIGGLLFDPLKRVFPIRNRIYPCSIRSKN